MDTADKLRDASPWRQEPNPVWLAVLGKLAEELGELQAAVGRCIIQGVNEVHPVTGKPNIDWLLEEVADVTNMVGFVRSVLYDRYSIPHFDARVEKKRQHIISWLQQICPHTGGTFRTNSGTPIWSCCGKQV